VFGNLALRKPTRVVCVVTLLFSLMLLPSLTKGWNVGQSRVAILGGTSNVSFYQTIGDNRGGSFAVGSFSGAFVVGETTYTALGYSDGLIVHYSSTGEALWVKQFGGGGTEIATSVGIDKDGRVAVGGVFSDSFSTSTANLTHVNTAGLYDMVLLSYSFDGTERWTKGFGASGNDYLQSLGVSPDGLIAIGGAIGGSISFGGPTLSNPSSCCFAGAIAVFDNLGSHQWSTSFGPSGMVGVYGMMSIAISTNGKVAFGVNDICSCSFQVGSQSVTLSSAGDFVVGEFANDGTLNWVTTEGITGNRWNKAAPYPQLIKYNSLGGINFAGEFRGSGTFGGSEVVTSQGIDVFVQSFSNRGSVLWTRFLSSSSSDFSQGLTVDASDNVYVAVWPSAVTNFAGISVNPISTDGYAVRPVVIKMNSIGEAIWYRAIGGGFVSVDAAHSSDLVFGGIYSIGRTLTPLGIADPIVGYWHGFLGALNSLDGSLTATTTTTSMTSTPSHQVVVPASSTTTPISLPNIATSSTSTTIDRLNEALTSTTPAPIIVGPTVSAALNTLGTTHAIISINRPITNKSLAVSAKIKVIATSKVSLKVARSSSKFCKVSGTTLKGLKTGSCKVTVTVTPKKGKATSKTVTLKVTK
jgi:hypothetical protein